MSDIDTSTENSEDIADACAHFIDEESAAVVRALAAERDVLAARCAALEQAGRWLMKETTALLELATPELREAVGNTNVACIREARDAVVAALSTPSEEPQR